MGGLIFSRFRYIKKLQEAVKGKSAEELKSEENQIKVTALKTTSNISTLIRDLFHSPPSYKATIQLSWVLPKNKKLSIASEDKIDLTVSPAVGTGTKRHAPITFDSENGKSGSDSKNIAKKSRSSNGNQVYSPPSGKYSGKMANYSSRQGGNNNNRSRSNNRFRSGNRNRSGSGGGGRNYRRY